MIIDAIGLKNFGVYGGCQEAVFAPTEVGKPIFLFGGLNGGGKTTLLDSIQLALYGPKARCSGRGKLGYREYLREMIHRGANPTEGAAVTIRFRRSIGGEQHYYKLTRSWRQSAKGIEEDVEVTQDAEYDAVLSEHWDEYIEGYIPSGIAHLFFFDAEQIKDLADGEHAAEILGQAIHTLLGLDLVDRLDTDLIALARRKRAAVQSPDDAEKTKRAEEEIARLELLHSAAEQDTASLRGTILRLEKEISDCDERFRQEGGELYLIRADLESERNRLQKELATEEGILRELAGSAAPFLLIPDLLTNTGLQAQRESENRKTVVLLAALQERDTKVLSFLKKLKVSSTHISELETHLREDREDRTASSSPPVILNVDDDLITSLRHLQSSALPDVKSTIETCLENVDAIRERITRCELQLARVPSEEAIAGVQRELERLRRKLKDKQAECSALEDKARILGRQLEDARRTFERELGREIELGVDREQNQRVLRHSSRVRETLARFRVAVIHKHAARLERLVLESFTHLLRKQNLVTSLKIDPSTFRIELAGNDGKPLSFDRLSAGERQLLATSILWGLAKASGRPLPTVIDTPLGRLDSSHRQHLITRYFPAASHQVILLSTDEEVDEASLARLKPHINKSFTLSFDEKTHTTLIRPGYFWKHETTY